LISVLIRDTFCLFIKPLKVANNLKMKKSVLNNDMVLLDYVFFEEKIQITVRVIAHMHEKILRSFVSPNP